MKEFPIGLCSVSFRKHMPTEILEAMKQAGLSRIEWGSDIHAPADQPERLSLLAELQKTYGVTCSSYGTYFKAGVHRTDELMPFIQAAKRLGTSTLRIWAGEKNSEEFTETEKDLLFKDCRQLATIAEQEEVTLCTECHNKTYTNRFQSALELIHTVDSPYFQTYWQPNQFRDEEYNLTAASALSPFTKSIHVFHWLEKEKLPLADGTEQWAKYLSRFSADKSLLLEFMPDGRLESLTNETNALRSILEKLK